MHEHMHARNDTHEQNKKQLWAIQLNSFMLLLEIF